MDREKAEKVYQEILKDCKESTIYSSDLDDETIKFYQKYPEIFIKTKKEIVTDILVQKEQIIEEIMQDE